MFEKLWRLGWRMLAVPVGPAAAAVQRGLTSAHAIVEVKVEAIQSTHQRQLWLSALRALKDAEGIEAILFHIDASPGGWATGQDLREIIAELRANEIATYAFIEQPGNAAYWIASACERVFCVPTGQLHLVGVGVELTFFGQALERLGIQPDLEAAGEYKSFGESYTRSFASPANLEAMELLVGDLHSQLVEDISASRGISTDAVQALLEQAPLVAEEAMEGKLVDQLFYTDQLDSWLEEHHGDRARRVQFDSWARRESAVKTIARWGADEKSVAVLHLQGPIVMEEKRPSVRIRARVVVPMLKKLREDDTVGAVVLHVNSPGGGVLPSDLIWREVEKLSRAKPVVASFEDVSASGGYYLSAPATEIFARRATLTGSIGVFGGKMVVGEGLRKLGVTTQMVLAAPNANVFGASRRFTDPQRKRFRELLQRTYDGFVHRVAVGRRAPEDVIEPHCRGRVWTGRHAVERGLVDRIGSLEDAVDRARSLASLASSAPRIDHSGQPQFPAHRILMAVLGEISPVQVQLSAALFERLVGSKLADLLSMVLEHEGQALAMLPFDAHEPKS